MRAVMPALACGLSFLAFAISPAATAAGTDPAPASPSGFDSIEQRALKIDQIELSGVTQFSAEEVQTSLEIAPGDRLERIKVVRTAENLQAFYRSHGYEKVGIRSQLHRRPNTTGGLDAVLEFVIDEGDPTRISRIRINPDSAVNRDLSHHWKRLEKYLFAKLGITPGEVLDQSRISIAKRAMQDLLASEEFVGARIEGLGIVESSGPAADVLTSLPANARTARWVELEFRVDLGDRVTFGFRGNTIFGWNRLQLLVSEQRLLGFGKDYIAGIRLRIEELYRSAGYAQATARPFTFERQARQEKHVTYVINEGPRVSISSISFDGNAVFSSDELLHRFQSKASVPVGRGVFVLEDIQKAAQLTVDWMKSKGYLAAKLVTVNAVPVSKNSVRVVIYIYEGDQTLVRDIRFEGANVFTAAELREHLKISEGQPLNLFEFSESLEELKAKYRARGYLGMEIENENSDQVVRYDKDNRTADISLNIKEGPQYRVGSIEFAGLSKTKDHVVLRQLHWKVGDVLGEREIFESEARLRRLGIFSTVNIRTRDDPEDAERKIIQIAVQEGTPGLWAAGLGYRNDLGPRVFAQVGYANVAGNNHTLSLSVSANRRFDDKPFIEGEAQLGYLWPAFFQNDITFRPTLTFSSSKFIEFDAQSTVFALNWEKPLLAPHLTGLLSWNLERIRQFNARKIDIDNIDAQLASLGGTLRLDLRDDPLNPSSGFFAQASGDLTAPWLGSQTKPYPVGFVRVQMRSDYHLKLAERVSWLFSLRSGFARNNEEPIEGIEKSGIIPSVKTFALGGTSSLRGFKEQQLNLFDTAIRGSMAFVNYRTQIDLPVSGALRFGPFLDAASIFTDPFANEEIRNSVERVPFRWRYGAGIGLRYQTPVGSVNLDLGFNLKPELQKPELAKAPQMEDRWILHFSIGVI